MKSASPQFSFWHGIDRTSIPWFPTVNHDNCIGWLRTAVLGANDGIVSTASLIVGVAAAEASRESAVAAHAGGSSIGKSVARVTFWGALAMALTAAVGALFGTTV